MSVRSLNRTACERKRFCEESRFYQQLSKTYLNYFGNPHPKEAQLKAMQELLCHLWVRRTLSLSFNDQLTMREQQCLYHAIQGKSIKETATLLHISVRSIEVYRHSLIQKLGCRNMNQAIGLAIRLGLLDS